MATRPPPKKSPPRPKRATPKPLETVRRNRRGKRRLDYPSQAMSDGFYAFQYGLHPNECLYSPTSRERSNWSEGYRKADPVDERSWFSAQPRLRNCLRPGSELLRSAAPAESTTDWPRQVPRGPLAFLAGFPSRRSLDWFAYEPNPFDARTNPAHRLNHGIVGWVPMSILGRRPVSQAALACEHGARPVR
jgi:hypothetical protein